MNNILDIISIIIIGLIASGFIIKTYFKMSKNKCATMCNGCSGGVCSIKNFATTTNTNKITTPKPIKWQ